MDSHPRSPERRTPNPLLFMYKWAANVAVRKGAMDTQYESTDPNFFEPELRRNADGGLAHNFLFQQEITPTDNFEATEVIIDFSEGYETGDDDRLPDSVQLVLRYPYGALKTIYLYREDEDVVTAVVDIRVDEAADTSMLAPEQLDKLFELAHHFDARRMLMRGTDVTRDDMDEAMYALGQL